MWSRIKASAREKGLDLTLSSILALAKALMEAAI